MPFTCLQYMSQRSKNWIVFLFRATYNFLLSKMLFICEAYITSYVKKSYSYSAFFPVPTGES